MLKLGVIGVVVDDGDIVVLGMGGESMVEGGCEVICGGFCFLMIGLKVCKDCCWWIIVDVLGCKWVLELLESLFRGFFFLEDDGKLFFLGE